ncbi:MAG: 50S ribosomal protein L9 [Candidatus Schekmanbacteria bacterium RBG_16_38_11]|uniref:Large ribosomal subunit protein bL9 n=1 Tax=Candidatus Schekmanbacteria bacterium RBG_16_38_11 TaxID=1817880 RepID=A0A1F7RYF1_9BACT|nr:MAG: 50S ribosomal protein L9 [Candidatus Schekmanbacteria bacterium RBG_16_38_11]
MEVLLKKEVKNLGKQGDIVKVKDGFGRNYLFPKGLAAPATAKNLKVLEQEKLTESKRLEKVKKSAEEVAERLKKISCTIVRHAGEEDKLFGSVTSMDIGDSLRNEGFEIDKKDVLLDEPIKKLGIYQIPVKVHPEITVEVKVWVVKDE